MTIIFPWQETELTFTAAHVSANPYLDVECWADFRHSNGTVLRRPAFWDGGQIWKIRFASPFSYGEWMWTTASNTNDGGLNGQSGTLVCASLPEPTRNRFFDRGFWRMSPGRRNLVHADGTACLLVGDTAWALPWRATVEQCETYARDRHRKGFNAALLMAVQPDRRAVGPRSRTEEFGFDVAFEDLPQGHLNEINVGYFQDFDTLIDILVRHEIVPVYQPVFHGYGWKGLDTAGPVVPSDEYARFARYLVARYGARPAMYLVGADSKGDYPQIGAAGTKIEQWDCYDQPTGIHYSPTGENNKYQEAEWLDFQWCQTGHNGDHMPERVADMWRNVPPKGIANAEPTYENIGRPGNGAGWWQGHEAWCNLCAGGTMGTVYGAGSLWQWKLHKDEPGHEAWAMAVGAGWREALDFEGSTYVGLIARIFDGLPLVDMKPDWSSTIGRRGLLVPGKLLICYQPLGGDLHICGDAIVPLNYRVLDPKTASVLSYGTLSTNRTIPDAGGEPRIYILSDTFT